MVLLGDLDAPYSKTDEHNASVLVDRLVYGAIPSLAPFRAQAHRLVTANGPVIKRVARALEHATELTGADVLVLMDGPDLFSPVRLNAR